MTHERLSKITQEVIDRYNTKQSLEILFSDIYQAIENAIQEEKNIEFNLPVSGSLPPHDPEICGCENHADYCPYNPNRIE